ncbi:MAG: S8 family serine peptidase [Candidatus Sericytochromatia bacterium]|nr:S8 family serine peptidase [Candidatus Sericytochromatia bacterium]
MRVSLFEIMPPRPVALLAASLLLSACVAPRTGVAVSRYVRQVDADQGVIANEWVVRIRPGTSLPVEHDLLSPGMALVRAADVGAAEKLREQLVSVEGVVDLAPNRIFRAVVDAAAAPDPWRSRQWALDVVGAEVFEQLPPGREVKVAVLDTGVDRTHPDMAEVTLPGFTVIANGPSLGMDDQEHGTHVAGLIGASIGNGVGIAGISDRVRILPVKVLDSNGSGTLDDLIRGLAYAKSAGAQVVNMSLSSPASSNLERQAVQDLVNSGVVIVAAAGNEGSSQPMSPAALPGVIAVAATDPGDARADFSSFGSHVRLAAPGTDMISAVPGASYRMLSGTSQASPIVAGIAASILSVAPGTSASVIRDLLYETGARTTGFPQETRRVDLRRLMAFIKSQLPPATPLPEESQAPVVTPAPATPAPATPRPTVLPTMAPPSVPTPEPARTAAPATPTPLPVRTQAPPSVVDPMPSTRPGSDYSNLIPVADGPVGGGSGGGTPDSARPGFVWVPDFGGGSGSAVQPVEGGGGSGGGSMVPVVSPWW